MKYEWTRIISKIATRFRNIPTIKLSMINAFYNKSQRWFTSDMYKIVQSGFSEL